jgi:hypothetical protein
VVALIRFATKRSTSGCTVRSFVATMATRSSSAVISRKSISSGPAAIS